MKDGGQQRESNQSPVHSLSARIIGSNPSSSSRAAATRACSSSIRTATSSARSVRASTTSRWPMVSVLIRRTTSGRWTKGRTWSRTWDQGPQKSPEAWPAGLLVGTGANRIGSVANQHTHGTVLIRWNLRHQAEVGANGRVHRDRFGAPLRLLVAEHQREQHELTLQTLDDLLLRRGRHLVALNELPMAAGEQPARVGEDVRRVAGDEQAMLDRRAAVQILEE